MMIYNGILICIIRSNWICRSWKGLRMILISAASWLRKNRLYLFQVNFCAKIYIYKTKKYMKKNIFFFNISNF